MSRVAIVLAAALAFACKGPTVPHPMTGESRYTCCNIHYEKPEINDANYQKGTLIPFGTPVRILEVRKNAVKFQPQGHPPIVLQLRYAKDTISMDQYLQRMFPRDDPRLKLRTPAATAPAPRGKKGAKAAPARESRADETTRKDIENGIVDVGMTKDQVIMALGYPPAHRTPSLDAPMWTYWANRWATFEVYFDGDRVSRVNR